jgi:hypothetical protein
MRDWTDLSFREKSKIEDGEVSPFDYLGDSFEIKTKVSEGIEKKEQKENKEKER